MRELLAKPWVAHPNTDVGGVGNGSGGTEGQTPEQPLVLPRPRSEEGRGADGTVTLQSCFPPCLSHSVTNNGPYWGQDPVLLRWSSGVKLCPPSETRDPWGRRAGSGSPSAWVCSVGTNPLSDPGTLRRNTVPKEEKLQEA